MAALAGFVSKIGLASGPLIASFLIIDYGFSAIINLATFGLLLGCVLAVYAKSNNHQNNTNKIKLAALQLKLDKTDNLKFSFLNQLDDLIKKEMI